MKKISFLLLCLSMVLLANMGIAKAANAAAADFTKDKIVTILVTAPPGSTNDLFARMMATALAESTGAKIAVENKTAAGGLVAQNSFYKLTKPDGLNLMMEATGRFWPGYLMAEKGIEYDSSKFEYIAGMKNGPYLLGVSPKGSTNTIELLKKGKNLKVPTSTPTSILSLAAIGVSEALSLDAKLVIGVASDAAFLALQQGEAQFMVRSYDSAIKYQKQGVFKPLVQLGEKRDPLCLDVPTLGEVSPLSDLQKRLTGVLFAEAKVFVAPPGTPKDRVRFWDDSITKVLNNKDFQNKIHENFGVWFGIYPAATAQKELATLVKNRDDYELYTPLLKKYIK